MSPGLGARQVYERARGRLSWLCDRGVEAADALTLRARTLPEPAWPWVMPSVHRLGTLLALAGSAPRCDVWRVRCNDSQVAIIGSRMDAIGVTRMLEGDIEMPRVAGRVAQWRLRSGVSALLQDVDLVVCGLPAASPARLQLPRATLRFSSEPMVGQILALDRPAAELLRGPERSEVRRKLARLEQAGVDARVTRERDAFAAFHREMYLPHVERRHGRSAIITPADRQWHDTMAAGGVLLLLVRDDRPLAGVLLRQIGPVAFLGEEGLASLALNDPQLGSSLQAGLRWEGIRWALARGARHAALGLSPGWATSGVFRAKRLWRPLVEPSWRAGRHRWHFILSDRPTPMKARLDARRLITFQGGRPLLVRLPAEDGSFDPDSALHEAHTTGTAGIVVITAAGSPVHATDAGGS